MHLTTQNVFAFDKETGSLGTRVAQSVKGLASARVSIPGSSLASGSLLGCEPASPSPSAPPPARVHTHTLPLSL